MNISKRSVNAEVSRATTSISTHTIASQAAGATGTILLYPIDVLRIRFMSQDGTVQRQHNGQTYRSIARALATMYRAEGLGTLFRGCHVSVLGSVCAWGVYMYLYRFLCAASEAYLSGRPVMENFLWTSAFSAVASCTSALVCNPIWLMKTRMQIAEVSVCRNTHYKSFTRGLIFAVRSNGLLSLWRGVSAQVLLGVPNAFSFPVYDAMKTYNLKRTKRENLSTVEVCVCSTTSKTVIMVFAHPLHVLKTRLQDHRSRLGDVHYVSLLQSASTIFRRHGWRGMYRGITPSLLQSVPRCVLTFVLYEEFMRLFRRMQV